MKQFVDVAPLSGVRITADGYLVAQVRCARTGCQEYNAADFGMGDGVINVYRPESAVFDKKSLATFAGRPITMGHPAEPVTADNWKQLAVGDIGTEIARDGEYVSVPLKLMDAAAIVAVQTGTREVSMGYTTPYEVVDGVAPDGTAYQAIQTGPIRINHLAIVPKGRAGIECRIGDGAETWGAAPITPSKERVIMTDTLKTVVLGDKAAQVHADAAPIIEAFKADAAKALTDAKAMHDKALATKDAELAAKDAEIATLKAAAMTDAQLDAKVQARADLIAKVSTVAKDVKTAGLSDAAIKRAAVVAMRGADMADKSDAYIDAAFDLLADTKDPLAKPVAGNPTGLHAVYSARDAALQNAWKNEQKGA